VGEPWFPPAGSEQLFCVEEVGRVPSVTWMGFVEPLRSIVTVTLVPGCRPPRLAVSASALEMAWPSTAVITSPALRPAVSAGPPETTQPIRAPEPLGAFATVTPR
jgi:hypothetical protein